MNHPLFKPTVGAISVAVTLLTLATTKADQIFTLSVPDSAITPFAGPYGSVDVHLIDSTHATVTFTSDVTNGLVFLFGGNSAIDVNVNATHWTISNFSESNSGTGFSSSSADLSDGGNGNVNSEGVFDENVNNFDGFAHSFNMASFELTDTSGTWASAANVLAPDNHGFDVAAHVFVTTSPANQNNTVLTTGFVGNGTPFSVPDGGSTMMLLGLAMVGIRAGRRFLNV